MHLFTDALGQGFPHLVFRHLGKDDSFVCPNERSARPANCGQSIKQSIWYNSANGMGCSLVRPCQLYGQPCCCRGVVVKKSTDGLFILVTGCT